VIFDNIKNCKRYENANNAFNKAFDFLKREDLRMLSPGRYEIDGDNIFALVQAYDTKNIDSKDYEVHKRYIDLQYMLKGEERMGYNQITNLFEIKPYDDAADAMVMGGDKIMYDLTEGEFFIFFPEEPHMPGIMRDEKREVTKVVIKIRDEA
jgi:biofilm protein TabA